MVWTNVSFETLNFLFANDSPWPMKSPSHEESDCFGNIAWKNFAKLLYDSFIQVWSRDWLEWKSLKDGPSEHRKCLCKHKECFWTQKSPKCPAMTNEGATFDDNHSNTSISDLSSISGLPVGLAGLRSIIRDLQLTNNGNISISLNLL